MVAGYGNYSCWRGHLLLTIEASAIEETAWLQSTIEVPLASTDFLSSDHLINL